MAKKKFVPEIGEKALFTNDDNEFVASVSSFDPLVVIEHSVKNGCQSEMELSIDSLSEYTITPLTKDEAFLRLANG